MPLALALALPAAAGACRLGDLLTEPDRLSTDDPRDQPPPAIATRLIFLTQPQPTRARTVLAPVQVIAADDSGEPVESFGSGVTLALESGSNGGRLAGALTQNAASGIATFADLVIDEPGSDYRLKATAQGLEPATSAAFDIAGGREDYTIAAVTGGGQTDTAAATLEPFVVRVTTRSGRPATGITIAWAVSQGGGSLFTVNGTTGQDGQAGTTFTLGHAAGTHTVTASAETLGSPITFTATATHATPDRLVFIEQPVATNAFATISPPVRIVIEDRFGNPATTASGLVSISLTPGTGSAFASLMGTLAQPIVNAIATFHDLSVSMPGSGYRLRARIHSLEADSSPFDIYFF